MSLSTYGPRGHMTSFVVAPFPSPKGAPAAPPSGVFTAQSGCFSPAALSQRPE
jgi:hypothetical protein